MGLLSGLLGKVATAIPGIGTAASIIGIGADIAGKFFAGRKQKKLANAIKPVDPEYQVSEQAKTGLARAKQLYGGRMAGAAAQEKNIASTMANQQAAIERNSTNSADNLYMAAVTGAGANEATANLQQQEAANQVQMNNILTGQEDRMIGETDKVFQDKLRKYTEAVSAKNSLMNASYLNKAGAAQSLAQGGLMLLGSGIGQGGKKAVGGLLGGGTGMINPATVGASPLVPGSNTAMGMNPMVAGAGGLLRAPGRSYNPSFIDPIANINAETRKRLGL
jgi:hypothetical protein